MYFITNTVVLAPDWLTGLSDAASVLGNTTFDLTRRHVLSQCFTDTSDVLHVLSL